MKYKHYAPSAPIVLLDGTAEDVLHFLQIKQQEENCAILCYDEETPYLSADHLLPVGARDDLGVQAHRLFDALRRTEEMKVDIIYGHLPPMDGIGLALYNRMIRAAAHTIKKV
jgi:L-threonylcarbamoyladenylate synthase